MVPQGHPCLTAREAERAGALWTTVALTRGGYWLSNQQRLLAPLRFYSMFDHFKGGEVILSQGVQTAAGTLGRRQQKPQAWAPEPTESCFWGELSVWQFQGYIGALRLLTRTLNASHQTGHIHFAQHV